MEPVQERADRVPKDLNFRIEDTPSLACSPLPFLATFSKPEKNRSGMQVSSVKSM